MTHDHRLPSPNLKRLVWFAGLNGISIAVVATCAVLVALLADPDGVTILAGLGVLASGCLEIRGCLLLKEGRLIGLDWARWSQVGVFFSIAAYSIFQYFGLTPDSALARLSPEMTRFLMDLYDVDEWVLGELLYMVGQATYVTLVAASLIYQGGLFWYYSRSLRRLSAD